MQTNIEEERACRPEFTGAFSICFGLNMTMVRSICINTNTCMVCWFRELNKAGTLFLKQMINCSLICIKIMNSISFLSVGAGMRKSL